MAESTVKPLRIEVRKARWAGQDLYLFVYLRENLATKTITDIDGGEQTLYTYDETQVRLPVPVRMQREASFATAARRRAGQGTLKSAIHAVMQAQTTRGDEVRQAVQDALTPPTSLFAVGRHDGDLSSLPSPTRGAIVSALTSQAEWTRGELSEQ